MTNLLQVATILLIFFVTTVPYWKGLVARYTSLREINAISTKIDNRTNYLKAATTDLQSIEYAIDFLAESIPKQDEMGTYLSTTSKTISQKGFKLQEFFVTPNKENKEVINLDMTIEGNILRTPELIKALENLRRLTVVEEVQVTPKATVGKVSLKVSVYNID